MANRATRLSLNPIVRAHLDRRFPADIRARQLGSPLTHYRLTGPGEAEFALLARPYEEAGRREVAAFVRRAERHGLRTIVFSASDVEPVMAASSVVLVQPGPTRGAQPHATSVTLPYFFTDRAGPIRPRHEGSRPRVVFCGQAANRRGISTVNAVVRAALIARNRIHPTVVPPPLGGHLRLRAAALQRLAEHPGVEHRFVIRDRYRAGAATQADVDRTQDEFDANLNDGDYALCVRGVGNFSARLYEALSFGRIPVLVDTGGVLPFEDRIDWRQICVWVDPSALDQIGDLVVAAHDEGDAQGLRSPEALRRIWLDHLTEQGFFETLVEHLRAI